METAELLTKFYRLMNLYNSKAKKPHAFSDGLVLYPAQTHMIEIIGDSEGITLTQIADEYMITKGAVSQIIKFLEEKSLILKKPSEKGGRTTELYLSEAGRRILSEHREMHREMTEKIAALMDRLTPETVDSLSQIANIIEDHIWNL